MEHEYKGHYIRKINGRNSRVRYHIFGIYRQTFFMTLRDAKAFIDSIATN